MSKKFAIKISCHYVWFTPECFGMFKQAYEAQKFNPNVKIVLQIACFN